MLFFIRSRILFDAAGFNISFGGDGEAGCFRASVIDDSHVQFQKLMGVLERLSVSRGYLTWQVFKSRKIVTLTGDSVFNWLSLSNFLGGRCDAKTKIRMHRICDAPRLCNEHIFHERVSAVENSTL